MPMGAGVFVAVLLFAVGALAMIFRRDLVIKLLALGLVNAGTILCLVSLDARPGAAAPFLGPAGSAMVDPLPQALVLSAIAINFAILSLALVFVMRLVERYHTTDAQRIDREARREED